MKMETFSKVNFLKALVKALQFSGLQMEENMKGITRKESEMDKEC